jgi:hypothetical protein
MPARIVLLILAVIVAFPALGCHGSAARAFNSPFTDLERIRVSSDGRHFVRGDTGERFLAWGVNYDHDHEGRLLEDYWIDEWETVIEDFAEIKALGANVVRIHLQFGKFMDAPDVPNEVSLRQLRRLVQLAEATELYLDITGLACYHKDDVPEWYDKLGEAGRWRAQTRFWEAVASTCAGSPAVFCYDPMNEPVLAGSAGEEAEWLLGEFGGKYFVQRITLDLAGREGKDVARAWIETLVDAIRRHDPDTLITVGVIPWAMVWPNARPVFHDPVVGARLDFVSVHFYPKSGEIDKAMDALAVYDVGKPLLIEEMFPLQCSSEELAEFINESRNLADGWISFYWGRTIAEYDAQDDLDLAGAITRDWLKTFRELGSEIFNR